MKDFLDDLDATSPELAATVFRKFEIFAERGWEKSIESKLLKHVEGKVFEIKVKGGQPRVLGFGWKKRFVAASAEIKKTDDLDPETIKKAEACRVDWMERHGKSEERNR